LHGKWKTSQNRPAGERERIAAGLDREEGGAHMAALMRAMNLAG
jgi:predicted FMN-binding regulatory protein PaiB